MTWNPFRRRKQTVTVVVKIDRLDEILAAIRPPAPPPPPEAPEPKPTDHDLLFKAWIDAKAWPEIKKSHIRALHQIAMGRRPATPEFSVGHARSVLSDEHAPGFD